jgi:hypothetical protein
VALALQKIAQAIIGANTEASTPTTPPPRRRGIFARR